MLIKVASDTNKRTAREIHEINESHVAPAYKQPWVETVGSTEAYRKGYDKIDWSKK